MVRIHLPSSPWRETAAPAGIPPKPRVLREEPKLEPIPSTVMRDMKRSETAPPRGTRNLFRRSFEYREAIGIIADPGYGGDYGA